MQKFHITETGNPAPCSASVRTCPRGGEDVHFSSADDARKAYELVMATKTSWESASRSEPVFATSDPGLQNMTESQLRGNMTTLDEDIDRNERLHQREIISADGCNPQFITLAIEQMEQRNRIAAELGEPLRPLQDKAKALEVITDFNRTLRANVMNVLELMQEGASEATTPTESQQRDRLHNIERNIRAARRINMLLKGDSEQKKFAAEIAYRSAEAQAWSGRVTAQRHRDEKPRYGLRTWEERQKEIDGAVEVLNELAAEEYANWQAQGGGIRTA